MNIKFNNVYIDNYFTFLGSLENNIIIKNSVDKIVEDYYMNKSTYEEGEVEYQSISVNGILKKTGKKIEDIGLMIGGDLQSQLFASNYNASKFDIPFLGIYSACASFIEGLIIAASLIKNGINNIIVLSSSNNLVTEKIYKFPVEYGAIRKKINSFTATGSVSCLVTNKKSKIKIESATIGKVIELGHCDANNMGACMAPSVGETLYNHLKGLSRKPDYYDVILTGDLGIYGLNILKDYLKEKYNMSVPNLYDAGMLLYNISSSSSFSGGSGPICAPLMLFTEMIKKYKKILVLGSGSLHSQLSTNLGKSMVGVSHLVSLEVLE